jgi:small ligand-binding sensory domain FIST
MQPFPFAHATHPQWHGAAALVLAQLRAQMAGGSHASAPNLGLLYITDDFVDAARDILDYLGAELPGVTDWSGTVGIGIAATNVEYFDEPAMAVMLLEIPSDQFRVFSGVSPLNLGFEAQTSLVHVDPSTPDVTELLGDMARRTESGYLFGGLSSSRARSVQFALSGDGTLPGQARSKGVFSGGMSGVAFGPQVDVISRVTQGCKPVSKVRVVTEARDNVVIALDGEPALDTLLTDLKVSLDQPEAALSAVRATLVALAAPRTGAANAAVRLTGNLGNETQVRQIIGLDPGRRAIAVGDAVHPGLQLAFCRRNAETARADLMRICAEIREELEPSEVEYASVDGPCAEPVGERKRIVGAVYVSCVGRGGAHFGWPHAEMQIVRQALGDVPLVGFFASGEVAYEHLYAFTGVLTVFTASAD